jgi:hypothetical protein
MMSLPRSLVSPTGSLTTGCVLIAEATKKRGSIIIFVDDDVSYVDEAERDPFEDGDVFKVVILLLRLMFSIFRNGCLPSFIFIRVGIS